MDSQFSCGVGSSLLEDIYYGYANEETSYPRERTRKLTLTDITDEFDDVLDNDIPEEINAEEAFGALEDGVKEWKARLEQVMGDGLRRLKRNIRDKRLAVKYIPGVHAGRDELGILNGAKLRAIRDCEVENAKIMGDLSRRIERIFDISRPKVNVKAINKDFNQNKKKLINISCAAGGGLDNFKELLRSIGSLPESSVWSFKGNTIPIYSPNCDTQDKYALVKRGCTDVLPAYTRWCLSDIRMNPKPLLPKNPLSIDIKEDFKIKHFNDFPKTKRTATVKRPIPKAKQTKRKLNKRYELREFVTKTGVTKVFISRRNERQVSLHESEDIYYDWIKLVERPYSSGRPRSSSPPEPVSMGPFLYSEVLKRNLRLGSEAPEDIYESSKDFLFAQKEDPIRKRNIKATEPEDFFQSWKYNLNPVLWGYELVPFYHEKIFRSWRRNLFEPKTTSKPASSFGPIPENYFADWHHNFQEQINASKFNRRSSKRQSRRKKLIKQE